MESAEYTILSKKKKDKILNKKALTAFRPLGLRARFPHRFPVYGGGAE